MNKNEIMKQILEDYIMLSETQKDHFSRIVNRLLSVNYICGSRKKDRNDYYFLTANEKLIKNYLSILDYEFYIKKTDLVAYITNKNNYNHLNINKLYSVILLLLRKLYYQKIVELQEGEDITITLSELHNEIEATGLYDKRITKTELKNVYTFLSKYNICERIGELNNDESRLIIYPTINYILPITKLEEITQRINSYKGDSQNEELDESEVN